MEMNLPPLSAACFVTGRPFAEGERVASFLVRQGQSPEVLRHDVAAGMAPAYVPAGEVACSWVQVYKPRRGDGDAARAMKLTAENLFVTLADPATEATPGNTRLVQFLALLLERKRLLRPRGRSADGGKMLYEHARSKLVYEVPAGEWDPEFFLQVQTQLSVLVGPPRTPVAEPQPAPA
jgi:hypothetical protein